MENNIPKKNFLYYTFYRILNLIIPFIVTPYLVRVLGVDGVGIYSYTYSIVYYFMLITLLGVNNYGNRLIAKVRDNKKKLSNTFWEIYLFQLLMGIIMLIIYISYIFIFDNQYKIITLIQSLFIISSILDINWFYFGLEEFKLNVIRNFFIKVASLILIFLFVNDKFDLWKYVLIMSSMTLLSQLFLWIFLKRKINFVKIKKKDIIKHIKPNFVLFIPVIMVSMYNIMDKIMLGFLTSVKEVGYYDNAEKVISIPMIVIISLGTVMLPRISNKISKGETKEINNYISKSLKFVMFLAFSMCFGLIAIGYDFSLLYFGKEFEKTGLLIMILSCIIPLLSFANVIRTQYLIPKEKDKIYIISVMLGCIVNFTMNIILIPRYLSIGACIGTIAAELMVTIYQVISVRKDLPIKQYLYNSIPFFIKAVVMFVFVYTFNYLHINSLLKILIQMFVGILLYCLLNIKYILSMMRTSRNK